MIGHGIAASLSISVLNGATSRMAHILSDYSEEKNNVYALGQGEGEDRGG